MIVKLHSKKFVLLQASRRQSSFWKLSRQLKKRYFTMNAAFPLNFIFCSSFSVIKFWTFDRKFHNWYDESDCYHKQKNFKTCAVVANHCWFLLPLRLNFYSFILLFFYFEINQMIFTCGLIPRNWILTKSLPSVATTIWIITRRKCHKQTWCAIRKNGSFMVFHACKYFFSYF